MIGEVGKGTTMRVGQNEWTCASADSATTILLQ